MFLHTNTIGRSSDNYVRRHVCGITGRQVIHAPFSQKHYREYFNAVDINDRDSADYSTSIRTITIRYCYYIRLLCWSLDRVIHTLYVIVCECAKAGIGKPEWKKYLSKHNGRHDFQIHLALALISYAISLDWDGISQRPDWMLQKQFVPCNCRMCYFCRNGHNGRICNAMNQQYYVHYKCGKRVRRSGCSDERLQIMTSSDYCCLCYRNHPGVDAEGTAMTSKQIKKACKQSSMGCTIYKEPICKACWPAFDHGVSL
jgi:hypothetical protein